MKLRGRIPLRLAAIFGVIGLALCVIGVVLLVRSPLLRTADFARVDVGTTGAVSLTRTGDYVVYFETPASGSHRASIRMLLTDSSGQPVTLTPYSNTLVYDINGVHAEALFTFRIDRTGTYQVRSASPNAPTGSRLALGESVVHGIVGGVLCFVPGLLLVITAVILLIVGLVRRSGHKREIASAYRGGGGPNYFTGQPPA